MEKLDLIIFGAIAAVLLFKLYNTIGRTDLGENLSKNPKNKDSSKNKSKVAINASLKKAIEEKVRKEALQAIKPEEVPENLKEEYKKIKKLNGTFTLKEFLLGSEKAFEFVLSSYSKGDIKSLKPLVSKDIFTDFKLAADELKSNNQQLENTLVGVTNIEVNDIEVSDSVVQIVVKFVTEQINVIKNKEKVIVSGSESEINNIIDIWTFEKDFKFSKDRKWTLIETKANSIIS